MSEGILGNATGGFGFPKTYIITDSDGNELLATYVESETIFTATDNDVREGMVYASDNGVSEGTKVIPSYHTSEGMVAVTPGKDFVIKILGKECDFTKLQALFCTNSVSVDKVCINTKVYPVNSTTILSEVSVDTINQIVNFGITNEGTTPYILRYFTYREEY